MQETGGWVRDSGKKRDLGFAFKIQRQKKPPKKEGFYHGFFTF